MRISQSLLHISVSQTNPAYRGIAGANLYSLLSMASGMRAGRRVWVFSMIQVLHSGEVETWRQARGFTCTFDAT